MVLEPRLIFSFNHHPPSARLLAFLWFWVWLGSGSGSGFALGLGSGLCFPGARETLKRIKYLRYAKYDRMGNLVLMPDTSGNPGVEEEKRSGHHMSERSLAGSEPCDQNRLRVSEVEPRLMGAIGVPATSVASVHPC